MTNNRRSIEGFRTLLAETDVVRTQELPEGVGVDGLTEERPPQREYNGYDIVGNHLWTLYMSLGESPATLFFTTTEPAWVYQEVCRTCHECSDDSSGEHLKVLLLSGVDIEEGAPLPDAYLEEGEYFSACCEECTRTGGFGDDFWRKMHQVAAEVKEHEKEVMELPHPPKGNPSPS